MANRVGPVSRPSTVPIVLFAVAFGGLLLLTLLSAVTIPHWQREMKKGRIREIEGDTGSKYIAHFGWIYFFVRRVAVNFR